MSAYLPKIKIYYRLYTATDSKGVNPWKLRDECETVPKATELIQHYIQAGYRPEIRCKVIEIKPRVIEKPRYFQGLSDLQRQTMEMTRQEYDATFGIAMSFPQQDVRVQGSTLKKIPRF